MTEAASSGTKTEITALRLRPPRQVPSELLTVNRSPSPAPRQLRPRITPPLEKMPSPQNSHALLRPKFESSACLFA